MATTPAKKVKAPPRLKMLGVRVNDTEHEQFTQAAWQKGGTAAVLRKFVLRTINVKTK